MAAQQLRQALAKVESTHPGFSYEFVMSLVRKGNGGHSSDLNVNESLLRLQSSASEQDSERQILGWHKIHQLDFLPPLFQILNTAPTAQRSPSRS